MFRAFMKGKTIEEIAESATDPKPTPETVRQSIQKEREKFEDACLRRVLSRAKKGKVDAIDWLSRRGLFDSIRLED